MALPARRVAVATSGGLDSTALLHCAARTAQALGVQVYALHVHHNLMPQADAWQAHVQARCRRWKVVFAGVQLQGQPAKGDSVEAWARRGRYRALTSMAQSHGIELVLLAHHRRDQAETFLIQALRGGGAAGLAAMPSAAVRDGITWARPWLDMPREAIEAYARRHRLRFDRDPSNDDPRFARGRLRQQLWPALHGAFADAEATLARAAQRAGLERDLLVEVGLADLTEVEGLDGELRLRPWLSLSVARRMNVLRAWLGHRLSGPVPETLVRRLIAELPRVQHAQWPAPGGRLTLRRAQLTFVSAACQSGDVAAA